MKQVLNFVKLFLVILLVSLTSCTNDLTEKKSELNFSFKIPQEAINRSTYESDTKVQWNVNAQIENKKNIIQKIEKSSYSGEVITISFKEILVGQKVRINIDLTKNGNTNPSYKGTSDWFLVTEEKNQVNIKLTKIVVDNTQNEEDIVPPVIIITDAASPEIILEPQDIVQIATPESTNASISKQLKVSAKSPDGGILTFKWQKEVSGEWEDINTNSSSTNNDVTECTIEVEISKGESIKYRCIITNTNTQVNGKQTTTKDSRTATVAYVEGNLSSITAQYVDNGSYEIFEKPLNYNNIKVTETYTSGTNNKTSITFDASESRYDIQKVNNDEKAIGFVPYTVSCSSTNITKNLTVPVKYQLNANDFVITGSNQNNGNQEKIAQFTENTTLEVVTSEASNIPNKIYNNENSATAEYYEILQNLQSVWKLENQQIIDTAVNNAVAKTYQYTNTLTVPTENSWCVGDPIELEYEVEVCPWTLTVNNEDGIFVNLAILTGNTEYTLSATNEADTSSNVTWESSDSRVFRVSGSTLTTPSASTSNQTATITAIVGGIEVGSVKVTVQGIPLGSSQGNPFTLWSDLKSYLENNSSDETEIYVSGNFEATSGITVNRPVTIIPVGEVTITLYDNFSEQLFTVNADLTLKGYDASNQFTIDGDGYELEVPLISTDNSDITLEYVKMQNYMNTPENNSNPAGGAISFNCTDKTLSLKNCNFTDVITIIMPNEEFKTPIGAIYFGNGNLILDSCTFTQDGEYVDLYCYPDDTSNITLKGNITLPIIQYANAFTSYFGDLQITLDDFYSDVIKIYVDTITDEYDTKLFTLNNEQELPECFTLLNEGYEFNYEDGTITAATSGGSGGTQLSGISVTTASDLKTQIENGTNSVIIIANNITITECIDISNPVQIAANTDVTITSNLESDYMFFLYSNLTLGGGSGTLTITGPNHDIALIGTGSATKKITINNGVKFTNCSYYCLSLTGKDTLEINGGEFSSNTMAPIAIASSNTSAVINMSGGKIENNSATNIAAGIVVNNGTLNITGGTLQNNKLNETDSGASIYVSTYGNATIEQTNTTLSKNAHYKKAIINGIEQ